MPDKELLGKENKNLLEILKTIQQYGMGALSQKETKQFLDADIQGDLDKEIKYREELSTGERDGEYLSAEERKATVRKRRMSASKFFGREEKKTKPDNTGTSDLAVRSKTGRIDTKKLIPEPTEENGGALSEILTGVNSIVDTLKAGQKQDKKQKNFLQRMAERFKRRRDENKLEFKIFDGIKKTASTLLKPFKSAWQKMLDFIGKVLLGRVLFKVLEWMGNPENQGKLNSIIKFFEDWWPVLLGGYLIFGNALTGFAIGLLKNVVVWGAKLVATVIPALLKAAVAMGPLGIAAATVLVGGAVVANQQIKKNRQAFDEQDDDSTLTVDEFQEDNEGIMEPSKKKANIPLSQGYVEAGTMPGMMFKEGGLVQHYNNATQQASNIIQGFNQGGFANVTETTQSIDSDGNTSFGIRQILPGEAKEMLAERGIPSMELMDGTVVPNFGKMGVDSFNQGIEMVREGMANNPEKLKELDNFLDTNPYAQPDELQRVINSVVPGSQAQVMGDLGDSITASARPQKLKQGGFVSGPGGVDKVPARLTAGEFVMSKGAVQKYGTNTLAAMNAAGGGTNIPTLMNGKPGYAGGGEVISYQQLVEKGGVINDYGNVGGDRLVEVLFPPKKKGLFGRKTEKRRALYSSSSELDTPIEDFLNSRLGGGSTVKPKSSEGTGFFKGLGNIFSGKTFSGEDRVKPQGGRGQGNKLRAVPSKSGDPNIQPSEKKKVTVAYEEEQEKMSQNKNIEKPSKKIPEFNVFGGRSPKKIKVLGISV